MRDTGASVSLGAYDFWKDKIDRFHLKTLPCQALCIELGDKTQIHSLPVKLSLQAHHPVSKKQTNIHVYLLENCPAPILIGKRDSSKLGLFTAIETCKNEFFRTMDESIINTPEIHKLFEYIDRQYDDVCDFENVDSESDHKSDFDIELPPLVNDSDSDEDHTATSKWGYGISPYFTSHKSSF